MLSTFFSLLWTFIQLLMKTNNESFKFTQVETGTNIQIYLRLISAQTLELFLQNGPS